MELNSVTDSVQLAAVSENGYSIRFIKNPFEQVQLAAVEQNGDSIDDIKNPSEQVQLAAVKQNGSSIRYIEHPSDALLNLCKNSIIKYILIEMKNGDITLNDSIFNKLNDTNWPELDIIKKSLNALK